MMKIKSLLFFLCLLVIIPSCKKKEIHNAVSKTSAEHQPDFIIEWWELIYSQVAYQRIKPPVASRMYAYLGISIYEAALPGMPSYVSMEEQLKDLDGLPRPHSQEVYDWPTVIIHSLYLTSDELFSRFVHTTEKDFISLRDRQLAERASKVSKAVFDRSEKYGKELADALIEWVKKDQFDDTRFYTFYQLPSRNEHPERWEPTESNTDPCEPYWSSLRPFFLASGEQCDVSLPVPFDASPDSDFRSYVNEILEYDRTLTEDQRDIAFHWADDPGETSTPPGHWTYIMNYSIQQEDLNLEEAAAIYALVGVGIADAFIASWYTKYKVNLLRPKTYIQEYMDMPEWEPLVETPPFPEFTSAHSVVSTVASELLTEIFGDNYSLMDSTHVQIGLPPRKINSFREAAYKASMSRVYGGIHYKFAIESGIDQGQCVTRQILKKIKLKENGSLQFIQKK